MGVGPVRIAYKNSTGTTVPPGGIIQLSGDSPLAADGASPVLNAILPDGKGPYAIDAGGGTSTGGGYEYGECLVPLDSVAWAFTMDSAAPGPAWTTEVGPTSGSLALSKTGSGYFYAGLFDAPNQRMLVMQKSGAGGGLTPHIVTELDTGGNLKAFTPPFTSYPGLPFKARPITDALTPPAFSSLTGPGEVDVYPTFLTGPTFSKDVIMVTKVGTKNFAMGGHGMRFPAVSIDRMNTGQIGTVQLNPTLPGTGPFNVNVSALNNIGRPIAVGEELVVDLMCRSYGLSQWWIMDFSCMAVSI